MKTKYKYIEFTNTGPAALPWVCRNWRNGTELGYVRYYPKWKEWEFLPDDGMAFTVECCRDIADFLDQLNKEKPK